MTISHYLIRYSGSRFVVADYDHPADSEGRGKFAKHDAEDVAKLFSRQYDDVQIIPVPKKTILQLGGIILRTREFWMVAFFVAFFVVSIGGLIFSTMQPAPATITIQGRTFHSPDVHFASVGKHNAGAFVKYVDQKTGETVSYCGEASVVFDK